MSMLSALKVPVVPKTDTTAVPEQPSAVIDPNNPAATTPSTATDPATATPAASSSKTTDSRS